MAQSTTASMRGDAKGGGSQTFSCGRPGKAAGKGCHLSLDLQEHKSGQANSRGIPFSVGYTKTRGTSWTELTGIAPENSAVYGLSCFGNRAWGPVPDNHYSSLGDHNSVAAALRHNDVHVGCPLQASSEADRSWLPCRHRG